MRLTCSADAPRPLKGFSSSPWPGRDLYRELT